MDYYYLKKKKRKKEIKSSSQNMNAGSSFAWSFFTHPWTIQLCENEFLLLFEFGFLKADDLGLVLVPGNRHF